MLKGFKDMKRRLHLFIAGGILLIGLILGSFFDLQINQFLFDRYNGFGLAISSFGMLPGYGTLAFFGGALFAVTFKNKSFKLWARIIFYVLTVALIGVPIYFLGRDVFNVNGFENPSIYWLGFVIMGVLVVPITWFGYFLGKKNENPKMWLIIIIFAVAIFMALVPGTTLLKSIFHRPRYRIAVFEGYVEFHEWFRPCKEYKDIISGSLGNLTKEEFKSFPSGHSSATMVSTIMLASIPLLNKKWIKWQPLLFWCGFAWTLLMMFSRMLVGAHYLSDTCVGSLLTIVFFYIANEIIIRNFLPKEEVKEEQPASEKAE